MVAPKDQAVGCAECHTRNEGRLASLTGFYLPGRDYNKHLDNFGALLFFGALLAVVLHGTFRVVISIRRKEYDANVIDFESKKDV